MSGAFHLADLAKRLATVEASLAAAVREIEILKADQPPRPSCGLCGGTGFVAVRGGAKEILAYKVCNHGNDVLFDQGPT